MRRPLDRLSVLCTVYCVLSVVLMLPLMPCKVPGCYSSRQELLRIAGLPGLPPDHAIRLRVFVDSDEHCGYCWRSRISILRAAINNWPDVWRLLPRVQP